MPKMPEIKREMLACLQCGYCVKVCEAYCQTPWESRSPRGKIYYLNQLQRKSILDKVLGRNIQVSPEFVESVYSCTGCGNCEAVCHVNIELVEFWEKVREWLVETGNAPLPAHDKLNQRITKYRNPYGEPKEKRDAWWPADIPREDVQPDAVFFAGCTGSYRMQEIAEAGVRVLHRGGVSLNVLGEDEWCCTSPALRTGQLDNSPIAAKTVVEKADWMGAHEMVMTCAGCYKTVTHDFAKYYSHASIPVEHFTMVTERLIKSKKLKFSGELKDAVITYHDPCHLGRHAGVFEPPRNIIKKIPGAKFVEMDRNRMESRCCGAGGGYKSGFNEYAVNIAAIRVQDALDTGANILATACPFCVLNLKQGAKQIGADIEVLDISQLLLRVTEPAPDEKGQ